MKRILFFAMAALLFAAFFTACGESQKPATPNAWPTEPVGPPPALRLPPTAPIPLAERQRIDEVLGKILKAAENGGLKGIDAPGPGFLLTKNPARKDSIILEIARLGNLRNLRMAGSIVRDTMNPSYGVAGGQLWFKGCSKEDYLHWRILPQTQEFWVYVGMGPKEAGFQTHEGGCEWKLALPKK